MAPLIVLVLVVLISRAVGMLGVEWLESWKICTRVGFAGMFLFTGIAHFNKTRADLVRMVPPMFPNPEMMVTITGLAEIAGAAGLMVAATSKLAAYALMLLMILMLPANISAARRDLTIAGRPATRLWIRVPLQAVWIALLWWSVN
jgi:uncharacterized membrane protein